MYDHPRQVAASIVIGVSILVLIVRLIQKGKLDIAYSWLWLGVGAGMLVVVLRYNWLVALSDLIGAKVVTTTLFLLGMIVILLMCLQFSMVISKQRRQIKLLTQKLAILTARSPGDHAHEKEEAA
jgi:hypothetical protein